MLANKIFEEPEVYKIDVPYSNIVTKETNIYVVRDQGEVLIVDMGAPTEDAAQVFLQALSELDIAPKDASYFFTHLHFDHSGLIDRILASDSEVFIGADEIRSGSPDFTKKMTDHVKVRFQEEGMSFHEAEEKAAMIEISTTIDEDRLNVTPVEEGDVIEVGRFAFSVIDLSGHTRGMVGLYQPDSGLCFSGDQLLFCITPACGLFLDGEDSIERYAQSMARLIALPITHLLHSHGEIRPDFKERAEAIMESRARRLQRAIKYVEDNPGCSGVDIVRNMGWKIPFSCVDDCEQRQQWVIYTQGIAMLDHLVLRGFLWRMHEPALTGIVAMKNTYMPVEDAVWNALQT